jgi:CheY-like chemotaxis protein
MLLSNSYVTSKRRADSYAALADLQREKALPPVYLRQRLHTAEVRHPRSHSGNSQHPSLPRGPVSCAMHATIDPGANAYPSAANPALTHRSEPVALVVEYDVWLRSILAHLLADVGFAVATASNGFSGIRAAGRLLPDVVVLGAALPELTSAEVAAELQAQERHGSLRIILAHDLLSASSATCLSRRCAETRPLTSSFSNSRAYVCGADAAHPPLEGRM